MNKKLSFNDVCKLVLEKRGNLEGTVEEREDAFIESLPPSFLSAYEKAIEILKNEPDGLTINDLYRDAVDADPESDKRPIQIKQFKTLIDKAKKEVGNIEFNVYSGNYSLANEQELEDIRQGDSPTIEDMDDLDSDSEGEEDDTFTDSGRRRERDANDISDIEDALKDYKRAGDWSDND